MSNSWKESPTIRKARISGTRKMATMTERTDREEMEHTRHNWRDLLEESGWGDESDEEIKED